MSKRVGRFFGGRVNATRVVEDVRPNAALLTSAVAAPRFPAMTPSIPTSPISLTNTAQLPSPRVCSSLRMAVDLLPAVP